MEYHPQCSTLQAETNLISNESLDCGYKPLKWCTGSKCQNLATIRNFIITLSVIGFLQSAVKSYFHISIQQAAANLNFDPIILDWLIIYSGIVQASTALLLLLYSGKFHPMTSLGGLVILQSAFSFVAIIPTLDHLSTEEKFDNNTNSYLCLPEEIQRNQTILEPNHSITTLALLFILQIPIELSFAAFYTIGITYVDDNTKSTNSAIFFGIVFCAYFWGSQFGIGISYLLTETPVNWWLGWAVLTPLLLASGFIIILFPRKLVQTLVEQAAKKILERNYHINFHQNILEDFNFLPTMTRLFTNRILILNLFGLVFMETANVNYFLHEQNYLQSRFFLPTSDVNGLWDEWTSRFTTYILRPPVIGISILVSGLIISKVQPKGRSLAFWNAIIGFIICLIYISYIFIDCETAKISHTDRRKITQPYCSKDCICDADVEFSPVCEAGGKQTYFSPCHAGCLNVLRINNIVLYQHCTCGSNTDMRIVDGYATDGACNISDCQAKWIIYQAITILAAALCSSTKLGRITISIRSVLPQDKLYALGLEIFLIGLIVYIPGKLGYDVILFYTCQYWSTNLRKCYLQDSTIYGNYLNILSAILVAFSLVFDLLVYLFAEDFDCFKKHINNEKNHYVPLQIMPPNDQNEFQEKDRETTVILNAIIPQLDEGSLHNVRLKHLNHTEKEKSYVNNAKIDSFLKRDNQELDFRLQNLNKIKINERDEQPNYDIIETKSIQDVSKVRITKPNETDF